ncbi:MAG: tRNA (N(6)-L-threonylcarbamoyladenosine(37)-C(2))-methylthiotransferase MtaB [Desulfobacterales bacterium]|nr:tRNA (N(6)-L-threonylcarbamoyladenosine(37)-C(2))-methylthiotransferase MtaB [Desulfobacterales bacterium]
MNDHPTTRRFAIVTLGCRVNQCESDSLAQQLKDGGWYQAAPGVEPDLVIVNTCTVTARAAMQSRQAIRRIRREHPETRLVVSGCYAQVAPEEIRKIDGVDFICGNTEKSRIPERVVAERPNDAASNVAVFPIDGLQPFSPVSVPMDGDRTRPVLKIQDGCNSFCSYCIVPYARGRSRSMPAEEVVSHIRELQAAGFHEAVLSGIHLGAYGADLDPGIDLQAMLKKIENETAIERIRLSSIEPGELTPAIVELVAASSRFCPHFHIPLQSGDDKILKKMGRPYTAEAFEELVLSICSRIPEAAIGVDVLVGFPGETDASHERTFRLIERLPVTYLHVFPFSPRPGTPAFDFPGRVSPAALRERCRRLRTLGRGKRAAFLDRLCGVRTSALVEAKKDPGTGRLKATTGNYVTVLIDGLDSLKNRIVSCRIGRRCGDEAVIGEILPSNLRT